LTNFIDILFSIIPFIFSIAAIALIPSKEKIQKGEIKTFKPETHVAVYLIALFPLSMGIYFSMPLFTNDTGNILIYLINAILLVVIAIGIMGVNYRNYSLFSDSTKSESIDLGQRMSVEERVAGPGYGIDEGAVEVAEVQPVVDKTLTSNVSRPSKVQLKQPQLQMVECPQCKAAIKVDMSQRPVKISCPRCGIEGMVQ
jgi:hypothetical protein